MAPRQRPQRGGDVLPDSLPGRPEPDVLPDSLGRRGESDLTPDSLPPPPESDLGDTPRG